MNAKRRSIRAIVALSAVVATSSLALPAHAATGVYGKADPTYDAVFRQSLAILGIEAVGAPQQPTAVTWLLKQQCPDGSFQAYRAHPQLPCDPVDAAKASGPDTNSTAVALSALMSLDNMSNVDAHLISRPLLNKAVSAAGRAGLWLTHAQLSSGGWPYFAGSKADANSTGLVLTALRTQLPQAKNTVLSRGERFLTTLQSPCSGSSAGALAYQAGSKPDGSATTQGLLGLTGIVPVSPVGKYRPVPSCAGSTATRAQSWVAQQLLTAGKLTSAMNPAGDDQSTATAILDLVSGSVAKSAVARGLATLQRDAAEYTVNAGVERPASLGMLLLVAHATGSSATNFGGINLLATLKSTLQ